MTCHRLPCAGQMARLRGMITHIGLGSLAPAPVAAPRPARARPAAVSEMAAATVASPPPLSSPPANGPMPLPLPDSQARLSDGGIPSTPPPEGARRAAGQHGERSSVTHLPSADGYRGRHTTDGLQAPAPQDDMRRPHPPAPSPLLSLQESGSTPADRPGSAPAPSARPPERAVQTAALPVTSARPNPGSVRAAEMPPPASQHGPTGAQPVPGPVHHRRPRPAAAKGDAVWRDAHGLRAAHDVALHPAHPPPPLSDTALRGPAGRLEDEAAAAAPDADARERQMRLDAAR